MAHRIVAEANATNTSASGTSEAVGAIVDAMPKRLQHRAKLRKVRMRADDQMIVGGERREALADMRGHFTDRLEFAERHRRCQLVRAAADQQDRLAPLNFNSDRSVSRWTRALLRADRTSDPG